MSAASPRRGNDGKLDCFRLLIQTTALLLFFCALSPAARAGMIDMPVVKLQSLDKITARTMTFEAKVGSTIKFGPLYIRIQSCREAPPIEKPESASFLQIWEVTQKKEAKWVFSGWMFSSSPALSPMDHPIYDVWVIDCLDPEADKAAEEAAKKAATEPAAGNVPAVEEKAKADGAGGH